MTTTVMTSKGQVVIPAAIRKHLKIKKGTTLRVVETEGRIVLQPMTPVSYEQMFGYFKGGGLVKSLLKMRREEKEREERKLGRFRK